MQIEVVVVHKTIARFKWKHFHHNGWIICKRIYLPTSPLNCIHRVSSYCRISLIETCQFVIAGCSPFSVFQAHKQQRDIPFNTLDDITLQMMNLILWINEFLFLLLFHLFISGIHCFYSVPYEYEHIKNESETLLDYYFCYSWVQFV